MVTNATTSPPKQSDDGPEREFHDVRIQPMGLPGTLRGPKTAQALIVFAHGSGSSRLSPRNTAVASALNARGLATLLFDLLMPARGGRSGQRV